MKSSWLLLCLVPLSAHAQEGAMPADAARAHAEEAAEQGEDGEKYYNAFDAPRIVVHGQRELREEERFGTYKQPRWTARRRFPTTRVFVRPEGQFGFEYWWRATADLENFSKASAKKHRSIYEWEWGLGHRLQLDLYLTLEQAGHGPDEIAKESIELRYALADWGEIWGNPTLYFEFGRHGDEASFVEGKLLLGGELAPGWHGGMNLVFERVIGDDFTHEYKVTAAVSRTIVDSKFSAGLEFEFEGVDEKSSRFDLIEKHYLAGPSLSWQPTKHMHLLLAPLFGIEQASEGGADQTTALWQNWLVLGWET